MAEADWADENPPPPKKVFPTWLWFCGGGCLVAVVLGVIATIWAVDAAKELGDPNLQWDKISEFVEVDEKPADLNLLAKAPVVPIWTFIYDDRFMLMLFNFEGEDAKQTRAELMDENKPSGIMGMGARDGLKAVTMNVQGREVPGMRFYQKSGDNTGHSIVLELTPDGAAGQFLAVQLTRVRPGEEITEEEVAEVLKPFHVGPNR